LKVKNTVGKQGETDRMNEQKERTTEQKQEKPTLKEVFNEMVISQAELARQAHVSVYTVYNALDGKALKRLNVQKLLKAINTNLQRNYVYGDIIGLKMEVSRKKGEEQDKEK
jgi:predicted transcriptional regulator